MYLFFDGLYLGLCLFILFPSPACVFSSCSPHRTPHIWLVSFLLPILDDFFKKKTHAIAHVKIFYYLCTRKRTAMINEDRGSDNICHYVGWSWEDDQSDSRRNQPQRLAYPQGWQACYKCPSLCGNLPLSLNLY